MADAAKAARAAALEEKRRRLEQLRERRQRRGEATTPKKTSKNLDEYIDGLLKAPAAKVEAKQEEKTTAVKDTAASSAESPEKKSTAVEANNNNNNVIAEPAPAPPPVKKVETFEVSTQTDAEDFLVAATEQEEEEEEPTEVEKLTEERAEPNDEETENGAIEPKLLSEQEREEAVASGPFSSFLNTASKKVERVLGTPVLADLLVNFVGETDGEETVEKQTDSGRFVSAQEEFASPKWTGTRDVTNMDWSPLHRELMLSSYHMPSSSTTSSIASAALTSISPDDTPSSSLAPRSGELQSDGLTLVWNIAMPQRPEHIFTCGSPILKSKFHPSETPLVIGACQSGQLVIWDVRAGRLPVQRSSQAHSHPICGMELHERGSGMVTADSEGKINFWSMGNLREPVESTRIDGGNVSSMAVAPESNTLLCGDESGALFALAASSSSGGGSSAKRSSKRSVRKLTDGHFGMVTSVSTRKADRAGMARGFLRGAGGLVLSAGVDWTVQLWAPAYKDKPLLSFVNHSYDYMCDVQWNPAHPSLFATVSSNGNMGLWNLASSLDESLGDVMIDKKNGLNKLKWSLDGRRVLVAAGDKVHVLSLSEEVLRKKGDESDRMMSQLTGRGLLQKI